MRNLLHKINLRLDATHKLGEEREGKRRSRVYLLIGIIALLGLTLAIYKILGYRAVEKIEVKIVQHRGQTLEKKRPLISAKTQTKPPPSASLPSQPTPKEEMKMTTQPPGIKKKEGKKVITVLPKTFQETPKPTPTKEKMLPPEKTLEIAIFPGKTPGRVMVLLKSKGIKTRKEKRKTTVDLYRVVVASTGKNLAKKLKEKTGIFPWRLKKDGKTYLVIASLMNEKEAQKMMRMLKRLRFSPQILTAQRDLSVNALVFSLKEKSWENMEPQLEKRGAHTLEIKALE